MGSAAGRPQAVFVTPLSHRDANVRVSSRHALLAFGAALTGMLGSACSTSPSAPHAPLHISEAWARQADSGATSGIYLTMTNMDSTTIRVVGFESTAARATQAHETMIRGDMSRMDMRAEVELAPGATITMKPGGLHVMLIDTTRRLVAGDTVPLTMRLADGRAIVLSALVRAP